MGTVILPGPGAVKALVVFPHQILPAFRVFPDPFPESVLDGLLLLLGQGGFLLVQNADFFPVRVVAFIVDAHIPQVQGGFQNIVSTGPFRAVGSIRCHVDVGDASFVGDIPFRCERGKVHRHSRTVAGIDIIAPSVAPGRVEGFIHELLNVFLVNPGSAKANVDFSRAQVLGLHVLQGFDVDLKSLI